MKAWMNGTLMTAALLAGVPLAGAADDDLAVVKRAVVSPARPAVAAKSRPLWLRVRVVDKGTRKATVSINVPLTLAHVVGDGLPLDWRCHHGERCKIRVSEVLATLETGAGLVEVDGDDSSLRLWVD